MPEGEGVSAVGRFEALAEAVSSLCSADTVPSIVEAARRHARRLCGAAGIAIVLRDGDECHYVAEHSAVPLWTGKRFPIEACVSGWAMINRQQVAIADIFLDERVPHEAYRPTGIHSLVMTPIGDAKPFAALGAYWTETRAPTGEELAVLRSLGECMGAAFRTLELRTSLETRLVESERRRDEREAARREVAFQAHLLDVVEEAVIATDLEGRVIYWNAYAERLYGWTKAEAQGRTVLELKAAPAEAEQAAALLRELQSGKSWAGEIVLARKDGGTFPAYVRDWPIHDPTGRFVGIVGVSWDNSERRRRDEHQTLLINELKHRVKNTLAVVQSMAHQTLDGDVSLEEASGAFQARLHALSQAHGLLIESGWGAVSLRALAEAALRPFGYAAAESRIIVQGPDLTIAPKAGIAIALALHELATNAAKYGALSAPGGRVALGWREDAQAVAIDWREIGGPPPKTPRPRGFGSRLLERGLAQEFGKGATLDFAPGGLHCHIEARADLVLLSSAADLDLFRVPTPA